MVNIDYDSLSYTAIQDPFSYIYKKANQFNCPIDKIYFNTIKKYIPTLANKEQIRLYLLNSKEFNIYLDMWDKNLYDISNYNFDFIDYYQDQFFDYETFISDEQNIIFERQTASQLKQQEHKTNILVKKFCFFYGNGLFNNKHNNDVLKKIENKYNLHLDCLKTTFETITMMNTVEIQKQ